MIRWDARDDRWRYVRSAVKYAAFQLSAPQNDRTGGGSFGDSRREAAECRLVDDGSHEHVGTAWVTDDELAGGIDQGGDEIFPDPALDVDLGSRAALLALQPERRAGHARRCDSQIRAPGDECRVFSAHLGKHWPHGSRRGGMPHDGHSNRVRSG